MHYGVSGAKSHLADPSLLQKGFFSSFFLLGRPFKGIRPAELPLGWWIMPPRVQIATSVAEKCGQ